MSNSGDWFENLKTKENPFEIYGLTGNPFPVQPVASPSGFDFNEKIRVIELEEIRDKFLAPSMQGEATNLWVVGPLGVGKSSLMLHVQDVINKKFGDNFIAIYIYSTTAGVASIYRDFIDNLVMVGMESIVSRLAERAIRRKPGLFEKKKIQSKGRDSRETFRSLSEAVTEGILDLDGIITEIKKELFEKFPYIDSKIVQLIMEYLRTNESIEDLKNVKSADKLNSLISLVHLIHLAGFKIVYLFIDQLEMGWGKWSRVQKERFGIDIRELVVRTKPLLSVEITCNEDIENDLTGNFPQLLRPLPKEPHTRVYVGLFNLPSIKKLIEWYLDRKRTDKNMGELAPFDEGAVKEIYDRRYKNTYEILSACHGLLSLAAKNKIKLITKQFVAEHLKETLGPLTEYQ